MSELREWKMIVGAALVGMWVLAAQGEAHASVRRSKSHEMSSRVREQSLSEIKSRREKALRVNDGIVWLSQRENKYLESLPSVLDGPVKRISKGQYRSSKRSM